MQVKARNSMTESEAIKIIKEEVCNNRRTPTIVQRWVYVREYKMCLFYGD